MYASVLLDSGASHNFIAAPQATKFSNNAYKSFLCSVDPMELHFSDNFSLFSHQIVHLALQFADGAMHTFEFWVFTALNHTITLGYISYVHSAPEFIGRIILSQVSIPNLPLFHPLLFLQHLLTNLTNLLLLKFTHQHSLPKLFKLLIPKSRPLIFI